MKQKRMTNRECVENLITRLFGEIGHKKGNYYLDVWQDHFAVVRVVNDFGGVTEILCEPTQAKLLNQLWAIDKYVRHLERREEA